MIVEPKMVCSRVESGNCSDSGAIEFHEAMWGMPCKTDWCDGVYNTWADWYLEYMRRLDRPQVIEDYGFDLMSQEKFERKKKFFSGRAANAASKTVQPSELVELLACSADRADEFHIDLDGVTRLRFLIVRYSARVGRPPAPQTGKRFTSGHPPMP